MVKQPDPCDYELKAPIFYYIRSLRIAYEIVRYLDPEAYVTVSGIAFPRSSMPFAAIPTTPWTARAVALPAERRCLFDAVGYKSYPHFDGSTQYFDLALGQFAYERHSDAAVNGIPLVKAKFTERV